MGSGRHIEVIARGVLVRNGHVLLCQNTKAGYYYLPGGHVEFGEPAAAAVIREFEEETGLRVVCGECVLVTEGAFETNGKSHHELNLVFHVEQEGPIDSDAAPVSLEPDIAFEFVDLAAIVNTDLRPLSVRAWLASGGSEGRRGVEWVSEMS